MSDSMRDVLEWFDTLDRTRQLWLKRQYRRYYRERMLRAERGLGSAPMPFPDWLRQRPEYISSTDTPGT